jgi:hypothetical protein
MTDQADTALYAKSWPRGVGPRPPTAKIDPQPYEMQMLRLTILREDHPVHRVGQ